MYLCFCVFIGWTKGGRLSGKLKKGHQEGAEYSQEPFCFVAGEFRSPGGSSLNFGRHLFPGHEHSLSLVLSRSALSMISCSHVQGFLSMVDGYECLVLGHPGEILIPTHGLCNSSSIDKFSSCLLARNETKLICEAMRGRWMALEFIYRRSEKSIIISGFL